MVANGNVLQQTTLPHPTNSGKEEELLMNSGVIYMP
jgi:hypothetical protein